MIIHPALLEQLVEMYWPALGAGRTPVKTVYLPSSIGHLEISRHVTELTKKPGDSLQVFCTAAPAPAHPRPIQVAMFATVVGKPAETVIALDDLTIAPILDSTGPAEEQSHRELCYKLDWEPIFDAPLTNGIPNGVSNGLTNGHEAPHTNGTNGVNGTNGTSGNSSATSLQPDDSSDLVTGDITIVRGESETQTLLASKLADTLERSAGKRPVIGTLASADTDGKLCIFLSELETPLLSSLDPTQFTALQKILVNVGGILWVVRGAYVDSSSPDANMITGLSRSIRSETLLKFATLDLDPRSGADENTTTDSILKAFHATFGPKADPNCELEFMEREGKFFTPRIINDNEMNDYVHKQTHSVLEPTLFAQDDRPLKLVIGTPGSLETLHFVDQVRDESLADNEIEIQVKAIGLNSKDVMVAAGKYDHFNFGMESSGVVTKIGNGVGNFAAGDRVAGISVSEGAISTYTKLKASFAFKIPDAISFEVGASIPVTYCTAYYGLIDLARLAANETVLIHGAENLVGQVAIRLAQSVGAVVTALATPETKDLLKEVCGLRDDQLVNSSDLSSSGTPQFDVVLKCQSTDSNTLRALWACLDGFGRFVEVEKQEISAKLDLSHLSKNRTFVSADLLSLATEKPKIMARVLSEVAALFGQENIKPPGQLSVFPISDVETAFKTLQSGKMSDKLVVAPQPKDEVKASNFHLCASPTFNANCC
jgi:NADPH:quinone reductase-like Zn-dependent oxidoreductase